MVQYYYEKYAINYYWDEISTNAIDSETLTDNTVTTTTIDQGDYPDYYCLDCDGAYTGYEVYVKQYVNGYPDYGLRETDYKAFPLDTGDKAFEDMYSSGVYEGYITYKDEFARYHWHTEYLHSLDDTYTIYKHREKGSYIETVVADDGTYPDDGFQDGYYWVKTTKPTVTLDPIGNKSVNEGQTLSFTTTASIDGTSTITYSASGLPEGTSYNTSTGEFSWSTDYYDEGTYEVTFTASANESTDSETITITVNHVDIDPYIEAIEDKTIDEGNILEYTVNVVNPDDVSVTLSASGMPTGATFDSNTGEFNWTPDYYQAGTYQVTFDLTWSGGSDSEIVDITVNEWHRPPDRISPIANAETSERKPYFEMDLLSNYDPDEKKYHVRLRVSTTSIMSDIIVNLNSKDDQSQWELWDSVNSQWIAFPTDGVDAGSKVRVKPDNVLNYGFVYWDSATWEIAYGYSDNTTAWKLNILISTEQPYVLTIEGIEYDGYSIEAKETSNGEIGNVNFALNNQNGTMESTINYGDTVLLAVNDNLGHQEQYKGLVRAKNPKGNRLNVSAITGDGILSERIIPVNYSAQDIGLSVKDFIDTYCSPLTSNNINTSTGFTAAIPSAGKTPLKVLEELRRQYNIFYFVDANWDVHFYLPGAIGSSVVTVRRGD